MLNHVSSIIWNFKGIFFLVVIIKVQVLVPRFSSHMRHKLSTRGFTNRPGSGIFDEVHTGGGNNFASTAGSSNSDSAGPSSADTTAGKGGRGHVANPMNLPAWFESSRVHSPIPPPDATTPTNTGVAPGFGSSTVPRSGMGSRTGMYSRENTRDASTARARLKSLNSSTWRRRRQDTAPGGAEEEKGQDLFPAARDRSPPNGR